MDMTRRRILSVKVDGTKKDAKYTEPQHETTRTALHLPIPSNRPIRDETYSYKHQDMPGHQLNEIVHVVQILHCQSSR